MGIYKFIPLIEPTTSAVIAIVNTDRHERPRCLSVIGELVAGESIAIERPLNTDSDPYDDNHWKQLELGDTSVLLRPGNDAEAMNVGLTLRVKKPVTVNLVGIRWS